MKGIVVAGYPKSGNTWVTRLVAQLVECPVIGYLNSDHDEIAQEGLGRNSDYQCFKSHHQFQELREININRQATIYVVRDPRDICISGSRYFEIERWPTLIQFIKKLPFGIQTYRLFLSRIVSPASYRINRMAEAVLYGSEEISWWVRVPWANHYKPYQENNCFIVKYEDLICEPERECKRILDYLGLERDNLQIKKAIYKQSFKHRKREFLKNKDFRRANFMRSGAMEQWRQKLPTKHKTIFNQQLEVELKQLGYPTDS